MIWGCLMKRAIFFAFLLSVGCVKENSEIPSSGMEVRRFDPLSVAPEDLSRLKAICDALASKEERLPSLESSAYTFAYSEKGCNESSPVPEKEMKVSIQKEGTNYVFRKGLNENFAFSNVETATTGVMAEICSNIHDLRSPLQTSSKGAVWFTTFARKTDCISDYNSICIHLAKGEYVGDVDYKIHSNEWIKFKVREERTGFFTERKLVSNADCGEGKSIEKRAWLK